MSISFDPSTNVLPDGNELVDSAEAARILNIKEKTLPVWRATKRYPLKYIKVGRLVRYRRSDLEAWLESRTQNNGGE